jgi:uncharacterized protein with GYD domain
MSIYISRGRYSQSGLKGMIANPEDRQAAVSRLLENAGCKLVSMYITLGEDDWLIISEAPNEQAISAAMVAAAASGSISNCRTTVAMTTKDAMEAFRKSKQVAGAYKVPGG